MEAPPLPPVPPVVGGGIPPPNPPGLVGIVVPGVPLAGLPGVPPAGLVGIVPGPVVEVDVEGTSPSGPWLGIGPGGIGGLPLGGVCDGCVEGGEPLPEVVPGRLLGEPVPLGGPKLLDDADVLLPRPLVTPVDEFCPIVPMPPDDIPNPPAAPPIPADIPAPMLLPGSPIPGRVLPIPDDADPALMPLKPLELAKPPEEFPLIDDEPPIAEPTLVPIELELLVPPEPLIPKPPPPIALPYPREPDEP